MEASNSNESLPIEDKQKNEGEELEGVKSESPSEDELSEDDWRPARANAISWVQEQISEGLEPRDILSDLAPQMARSIPEEVDNASLWGLLLEFVSEQRKRDKLEEYNTLEDVVNLILKSNNIIVLTGAGVSVSCGIPDFRSKDGIYRRLHVDFPDLPDPQAMFDIHYFRKNPKPFFNFAKEIYPGQFEPSKFHKFIRLLEEKGKLLRNYTQNIDTLEQVANIKNVIQCHGSFATATCCNCKHKVSADSIRNDIMQQNIPLCPKCTVLQPQFSVDEHLKLTFPVLKPDIVFFGEDLPRLFHEAMLNDKSKVDLLIVAGSSLRVRPVSLIPDSIGEHVPQIVLDRVPLGHMNFDIELMGNCDDIADELCQRLAAADPKSKELWTRFCPHRELSKETPLPEWEKYYKPSPEVSKSTELEEPEDKRLKLDSEHTVPTEPQVTVSPEVSVSPAPPRRLVRIADCLPNTHTYFHLPPSTYVFSGADIYKDLDENDDDSSSDDESTSEGDVTSDATGDTEKVDLSNGTPNKCDSETSYDVPRKPSPNAEDRVANVE